MTDLAPMRATIQIVCTPTEICCIYSVPGSGYLVTMFVLQLCWQGGHALGKTGKMVKKNSLQGKVRELEILLKIREKSGNFKKSYLCKVKIFKFYRCSDVATGGFRNPRLIEFIWKIPSR